MYESLQMVSQNQNMVLTHFWHKMYPDLVKSWMDLGNKEFTQTYQTGPIDRGRFIVITVKKSAQTIKSVKNKSFLFVGTVRVLVCTLLCNIRVVVQPL